MTTYKYSDETNTVVSKIDDDGKSRMSCSIRHPEYLAWLAQGNTPEPADPPPPPIDFSDVDNVEKALKALGLVVSQWNGKTHAQLKTAFKQAWDALP